MAGGGGGGRGGGGGGECGSGGGHLLLTRRFLPAQISGFNHISLNHANKKYNPLITSK